MALCGSLATLRAQTARMEIFSPGFAYLDEVFRPGTAAATRLRSAACLRTGATPTLVRKTVIKVPVPV